MSTKIHATVDALGNPTGFHLTPGQAHDLEGADALLPGLEADALLADKAYDADERVIAPLRDAEIEPVIPSKANRKETRPYDKDLYKDQNAARDKKLKKRSLFPLYVVEQLVQIERTGRFSEILRTAGWCDFGRLEIARSLA